MREPPLAAASFFLLLLLLPFLNSAGQVFGLLSRRAKCAIECYTKCANSGTPKAAYCNCPPVNMDEAEACNSVSENLLTEKTVERLIESETSYKDVRTILLRVEPLPNAFIYILEFSVQSAERPIWTFAGASSSPQITLSLPDACRDYQFRVFVILRSTNPQEHLVVFRPKAIPAQFPPFIVPKESIHMDRPKQSSDGQHLHFSISWQHPAGYDDTDIYGYSPPTAYPIRCQTPEDRLSQPRLELVQGGARLHLALPVDVLQERCRIYMEVRMLPRCVRIEPFDIQISVELDCHKFPDLRYCKREQTPQCTDVVDLWGKENGRAIVVWQRPNSLAGIPLFYIINWGIAQSQGSTPFVTRRIVQSNQIRVPGNTTKAELSPQAGVQYGLQICGFYAEMGEEADERQQENPFHIVPAIPFTCTPCGRGAAGGWGNNNITISCIDCSKIEETSTQKPTITVGPPDSVDCIGPVCASANRSSVHFISSDTVVLDVFGAKVSVPSGAVTKMATMEPTLAEEGGGRKEAEVGREEGGREGGEGKAGETSWISQEGPLRQRHSKTHLTNTPISLDVEEATMGGGKTTIWPTTTAERQETIQEELTSQEGTTKREMAEGMRRKGEEEEMTTTMVVKLEEEERGETPSRWRMENSSSSQPGTSAAKWGAEESSTRTMEKMITEEREREGEEKPKGMIKIRQRINGAKEEEEKGEEVRKKEEWDGLAELMGAGGGGGRGHIARVQFIEEGDGRGGGGEEKGERRMHQPKLVEQQTKGMGGEACQLANGIWCEFGCEEGGGQKERCHCPRPSTAICLRGLFCPFATDLVANFDKPSRTLRFSSAQLNRALEPVWTQFDRLHVEFGQLEGREGDEEEGAGGELAWKDGGQKEHWVVEMKDVQNAQRIFQPDPLSLRANHMETEEKGGGDYGLRVCAFNSSLMPLLMERIRPNWKGRNGKEEAATQKTMASKSATTIGTTGSTQQVTSSGRMLLNEEEEGDGQEGNNNSSTIWPLEDEPAAAFGIRAMMDPEKLMLAGPVFFLLGLVAGLGLFCSAFIRRRRRNRHSPLPSYSASSLMPLPRKYGPPGGGGGARKYPARSVLAARTAAGTCFGHQNGPPPVGFIGTPIGTMPLPPPSTGSATQSQQSCPSSNTSTASSATTVESRLLGTTNKNHQKGQLAVVHQPNAANFFADNTARFFMAAPGGTTKNVHF